jgi:hypothetical protein
MVIWNSDTQNEEKKEKLVADGLNQAVEHMSSKHKA